MAKLIDFRGGVLTHFGCFFEGVSVGVNFNEAIEKTVFDLNLTKLKLI